MRNRDEGNGKFGNMGAVGQRWDSYWSEVCTKSVCGRVGFTFLDADGLVRQEGTQGSYQAAGGAVVGPDAAAINAPDAQALALQK